MLKAGLTALLYSALTNASPTHSVQHIELSYSFEQAQSHVLYPHYDLYPLTYSTNLGLAEITSNLEEPPLPKYLIVPNERDSGYLKEQTYTIVGLGVATIGLMTLLPESVTNWDDEDRNLSNLVSKWKDNVRAGPEWDRDDPFLNYVMHPYFGGVYYTVARHAGYNEFGSFLYSAGVSTLFWEYGLEAFAEAPSWQDLFITPIFGAVVGELMLEAEQDIIASGGQVMGSASLGDVTLFFLNPVGHIHGWVSDIWGGNAELHYSSTPWFNNRDAANFALRSGAHYDDYFYGAEIIIRF
ncbi:DUF3943 domain-containing protein [Vibrio japonicus]|uniref:DUF3943 domain-containing protein n=1 Tax=Vibrio japonicus TaxID=1824638 RepID=A0ABY5LLA7_9VIBR|nr:DUF3943 domain-containing protein [Vibrio japonicus]UUM31680.1 DUF3943 domain-containing protein [Vibrio japonicus]